MTTRLRTSGAAAVVLAAFLAGSVLVTQPAPAQAAKQPLTGLFKLQGGSWSGGEVRGTYFRMAQPDGNTYLDNNDSRAGDKSYTLLRPGTDGGLRTGTYQATPAKAFDGKGNALSGKVTGVEKFFGVGFATATNKVDPQTGQGTVLPVIYADGTKLSGDLRAFAASWNNQHFNQGSPKPNGSKPGFTSSLTGTYNPSTKAFAITWKSLIVGGPFDKFTGEWHLVGTFVPDKKTTAGGGSTGGGGSTATPKPASSASAKPSDAPSATASPTATATASATATATPTAAASVSPGAPATGVAVVPGTPQTEVTDTASAASASSSGDSSDGGGSSAPVLIGVGGLLLLAVLSLLGYRYRKQRTA